MSTEVTAAENESYLRAVGGQVRVETVMRVQVRVNIVVEQYRKAGRTALVISERSA